MSYNYVDKDGLLYFWQQLKTKLAGKVDTESGKGLSTNDYTTAEKTKLSGIATGAEENVQSDWNATDTASDAYIKNKPTIPDTSTKLDTTGDGSNVTVAATAATTRANISTGEKLSVIVGKLMKWFSDLSTAAWSGSYTDLSNKPSIPSAGTTTPKVDGTAAVGTGSGYAKEDHVHPTDTTRAPLASPTFTGTPAAPTASAGTSTTQLATTAFVATAITNGLATIGDALVYKGTLGTAGTITALPTTYKVGWEYRVITAGTYAGQACEVGDLLIAIVARSGSGNANADWTVVQGNIDGYVLSTDMVAVTNAEIDTILAS